MKASNPGNIKIDMENIFDLLTSNDHSIAILRSLGAIRGH